MKHDLFQILLQQPPIQKPNPDFPSVSSLLPSGIGTYQERKAIEDARYALQQIEERGQSEWRFIAMKFRCVR